MEAARYPFIACSPTEALNVGGAEYAYITLDGHQPTAVGRTFGGAGRRTLRPYGIRVWSKLTTFKLARCKFAESSWENWPMSALGQKRK